MRDIAIIGGGLVGLCAALVLQHPDRRISIIEATDPGRQQAGGLNARSIALAASSVQIFKALGIWTQIEAQATPIRQIHISARGRWGVARMRADDYQLDALGYVIENQALSRCLFDAVTASDNIDLHENSEFGSIEQAATVKIGYRQKKRNAKIEARLVLIADGAHSKARAAIGIGHHSLDYGQSVVISNVEVSKPQSDTAYERFTPQGPLAMLPLGGKRYACVWTLAPDQAMQACTQPGDEFAADLQDCFGFRLGLVESVGERFSIPIHRYPGRYAASRALSIDRQCRQCAASGCRAKF